MGISCTPCRPQLGDRLASHLTPGVGEIPAAKRKRRWLPKLLQPMLIQVMTEAIKRSMTGRGSPGTYGIGKRLCHKLADFLVDPMTITMQW